MRLRLAPVEYKICATPECPSEYEGAQCPVCKEAFLPERVVKTLHDRLVLVDHDPPVYEPERRCRCTECKNLFDLTEHEVIARAQCRACSKPLLPRAQLQKLWADTETLLQRARKLDRALRQLAVCPHCAHAVNARSWCPRHGEAEPVGTTGGLPQNLTLVWVRTFHTAESVHELQLREALEGESEIEADMDTLPLAEEPQES